MARTLTLAIGVAIAMSAATALGVTATADPKRMVLRLADLPAGFDRETSRGRYVSNAELARRERTVFAMLYRKNYSRLARINGYEVGYRRSGLNGGLVGVGSKASIYRTGRGAHDSFLISVAEVEGASGRKFKRLALGAPLGTQARLFWISMPPRAPNVPQEAWRSDSYIVLWRHGRVLAEMYGAGVTGHNPRAIVALARKQQVRIAAND